MWDDNISHSGWGLKKMFESIPFSKLNITEQRPNTIPDDDKVSGKLRSMVDAMIVAAPSLDRQTATHFLLHTAHGRRLAEHLNSISKKKQAKPCPHITSSNLPLLKMSRDK